MAPLYCLAVLFQELDHFSIADAPDFLRDRDRGSCCREQVGPRSSGLEDFYEHFFKRVHRVMVVGEAQLYVHLVDFVEVGGGVVLLSPEHWHGYHRLVHSPDYCELLVYLRALREEHAVLEILDFENVGPAFARSPDYRRGVDFSEAHSNERVPERACKNPFQFENSVYLLPPEVDVAVFQPGFQVRGYFLRRVNRELLPDCIEDFVIRRDELDAVRRHLALHYPALYAHRVFLVAGYPGH
ncbi:Uncharacterised protein [uncultured archaeon]|nr:Uncharacterised protein [uncultured archaeon]